MMMMGGEKNTLKWTRLEYESIYSKIDLHLSLSLLYAKSPWKEKKNVKIPFGRKPMLKWYKIDEIERKTLWLYNNTAFLTCTNRLE